MDYSELKKLERISISITCSAWAIHNFKNDQYWVSVSGDQKSKFPKYTYIKYHYGGNFMLI